MNKTAGYEISQMSDDFWSIEYTDNRGKVNIVYSGDPEAVHPVCELLREKKPVVAPFVFDGKEWDLGFVSSMSEFIGHVIQQGYKIAFHNINVYEGKQYHYITAIRED